MQPLFLFLAVWTVEDDLCCLLLAAASGLLIAAAGQHDKTFGVTGSRFRALLKVIPDMIFILDRDGTFVDFIPSEHFQPWLPADQFLNKRINEVLPANVAQQTLHHIEQVLRTDTAQVFGYELLVDGKKRSYIARLAECGEDEVLAIVRDITEGKRTEEALRFTVEGTSVGLGAHFSRSLVKHLAAAVHVRYAFISQLSELKGNRIRLVALWTGEDYGENYEYDSAGAPCEHVVNGALSYFPDVGDNFPDAPSWFIEAGIEAYLAIPLTDSSGNCLGHMGVMHDGPMYQVLRAESILKIFAALAAAELERQRAEDALRHIEEQARHSQKMEAIGRLAGGVAHDFNNLLTAINGYAELTLSRLGPSHPLRKDLEEIRKAGERAKSLTGQLLAFSRRQVLQPKVLDLNEVVTNVDNMLRRLIGEDIELVSSLDDSVGRVKADPGQMEHVIINLAVNARDAMPRGGKLTIETQNVEFTEALNRGPFYVPIGRYVMLAVSDNGEGMNEETQAQIFEPFFTTKGKEKGTGLGLSTVYGIVKQSGGSVRVYSEIGQGSTFKIYLPRVSENAKLETEEFSATLLPQGKGTILLVEDEEGVRTLARRVLTRAGYTVLPAENAAEALRVWERNKSCCNMLLTDVVMPQMSGIELAERLRDLHPKIKVLFMSGYTDDAIVRHEVLEKDIDFLQKPFTSEHLARKVHSVMSSGADGPTQCSKRNSQLGTQKTRG